MRFKDARALHKGDEVTLKGPNTTDGIGYRSAGKTGFPTLEGGHIYHHSEVF